MNEKQLTIFARKTFRKVFPKQISEPIKPTGESSIMSTLPTYHAYLGEKYAPKTVKMYWGDIRELSVYLKEKKLEEITPLDLQQWIGNLVAEEGRHLERKTVNRKVSAVITYFLWLQALEAITEDPAASLNNARIQSPLPDYLYDGEIKKLYEVASSDPRTYLLVLLLLETGMKSNELFKLKKANIDISNSYSPELWIKHTGKETKKDRKVALPAQFTEVYQKYVEQYEIEDFLYPVTDRYIQMLFVELKKQTGIDKELTPKTLRHTHVVRAYRRGEDTENIFERIGLAPDSRKEAGEMYLRLARKGI